MANDFESPSDTLEPMSRRRLLTLGAITGGGLVAATVAACAPGSSTPAWTFGPGVAAPIGSAAASASPPAPSCVSRAGIARSVARTGPVLVADGRPRRERQGRRRSVPGRRERVAARLGQPAPRADDRWRHQGLRPDRRSDQAPDRRAVRPARRARVQRHLAGAAHRGDRRRQGPGHLHEQHDRVDRDPLPRTAPAQRDGRRPACHPGPDRAGRQLHLRVHGALGGLAHVPLAPQRHRPGRTRSAGRVHRRAEGPGAALRPAVRRDPGHRLDQQRRARRLHDQRPRLPGHGADRREARRDDRDPLHERGRDDASVASPRDADAGRGAGRLSAGDCRLHVRHARRQSRRALGRGHHVRRTRRVGVPLPHPPARRGSTTACSAWSPRWSCRTQQPRRTSSWPAPRRSPAWCRAQARGRRRADQGRVVHARCARDAGATPTWFHPVVVAEGVRCRAC